MNSLYKVNGLNDFFMDFGLERIEALMNFAGNPQNKLKIIHVAGTNGKGSTCRFLYYILKEHGLKTGLYTSPHLDNFNERIIVGEDTISDSDVARLSSFFNEITNKENIFKNIGKPTFFELTTAICFKYFFEKKVEVAVIETGLGGRLDATNIIKKPLVSVITNISADHKDILGNSLKKIALEKAGIIKKNSIAVCGEKNKKIRQIIQYYALGVNSLFFSSDTVKLIKKSFFFEYKGLNIDIKNIKNPNFALYQNDNLKLAVLAAEIISKYYSKALKFNLNEGLLKSAVLKFKNEGRFEIIKYKNNDIILDGAHNPDGIKKLIASLKKIFPNNNFVTIFAVMKDKDYNMILKRLSTLGGKIIFTGLRNNERALKTKELKKISLDNKYFKDIFLSSGIKESLETALKIKSADDIILICGSLYLIGEFKKLTKGSINK
ncbi:MAG: bifunctional folylpolyglutamate synthase/dihydrofolate synthase [bacterium]